MLDGNLREDTSTPVQLVHQLDADAPARRNEFDLFDLTATYEPEIAVNVSDWNAE